MRSLQHTMACLMHCHLKKCIQGSLESHMARVEVKSFSVPPEERLDMVIAWRDDGEAMFHDICWKAITDSYTMDNPFSFEAKEKEMVKEAWRTAEYFDSKDRVEKEAARIAKMLKSAKFAIAFTGAGISTSAGIGDFRGKSGKWTERDRQRRLGLNNSNKKSFPAPSDSMTSMSSVTSAASMTGGGFCYERLRPTYTHEALSKLLELGYLKYIVSQNTDGLHRLSGVPRDKISELHGNSFHERCEKCGARYERPYAVKRVHGSSVPPKICQHCHVNHRTGRRCERKDCDGYLINTIINFGDGLEHQVLSVAEENAQRCDLVLCLGSTLRVTPACDLVEMGQKPTRLIVCNRQITPFDRLCYATMEPGGEQLGSRVYFDCDAVVQLIMKNVLDEDTIREWMEGQPARMEAYAKQRRPVDDTDIE